MQPILEQILEAYPNEVRLVIINGRILEGAQPFATFKKMIDQELALRG